MKKIKSYFIPEEDKSYETYFSNFDHYQEAQRNKALAQVHKWNLAIDIGANIGNHTVYFSLVRFIEPLSSFF